MLSAASRVRTSAEHRAVARRGRRGSSGPLTVQLLTTAYDGVVRSQPMPSVPVSRAGFVLPVKVGPAVVRNRVRRQLRHLLAERLPALPPGSALVVRVAPDPSLPGPAAVLAAHLDRALAAALSPARTAARAPHRDRDKGRA